MWPVFPPAPSPSTEVHYGPRGGISPFSFRLGMMPSPGEPPESSDAMICQPKTTSPGSVTSKGMAGVSRGEGAEELPPPALTSRGAH